MEDSGMNRETKRVIAEALDNQIGEMVPVLDEGKGYIQLVDYLGDDDTIVNAARVSYGKGTKKKSDNRTLLRYLLRHEHTAPFEMCEITLKIRAPIFVAREWLRHRTASVNELSGRYSEMPGDHYVPHKNAISGPDPNNKQGRGGPLAGEVKDLIQSDLLEDQEEAFRVYRNNLERGAAKEVARNNLPLAAYTEWYWKIDLHNLMHFLNLRMRENALYEIRMYANAIYLLVNAWVPTALEAFNDYRYAAARISRMEKQLLVDLLNDYGIEPGDSQMEAYGLSKREMNEFRDKFNLTRPPEEGE